MSLMKQPKLSRNSSSGALGLLQIQAHKGPKPPRSTYGAKKMSTEPSNNDGDQQKTRFTCNMKFVGNLSPNLLANKENRQRNGSKNLLVRRESEQNLDLQKYQYSRLKTEASEKHRWITKVVRKSKPNQTYAKDMNSKSNVQPKLTTKGQLVSEHDETNFAQKQTALKPQQTTNIHNGAKYTVNSSVLLGAGTFGKVYPAVNEHTGEQVAIKRVPMDTHHKIREVEIMEQVRSPFVVPILDKYYTVEGKGQTKYTNIVMPRYSSSLFDLFQAADYQLKPSVFKLYLYQILRGLAALHGQQICHRDLKPQNILVRNHRVVICDLGSAKRLVPGEENVSYICSRCYRAPELILGSTCYSASIDMWSLGCIILEFLNRGPYFLAADSLHHLLEVMKVMGTPSREEVLSMNPNYDASDYHLVKIPRTEWEKIFPRADPVLLDLVKKLMVYTPGLRLSARQALGHQYFEELTTNKFKAFLGSSMSNRQLLGLEQDNLESAQAGTD